MTDKEKLQKLFQAALEDNSSGPNTLARAFPNSPVATAQAATPEPVVAPEPVQNLVVQVPAPPTVAPFVEPMPNAGLDEASSAELGALLDEQIKRKKRQRKRELVVTLLVCFGLTGGGFGWFVQSPARVQALQSAIQEIRSLGDIQGIIAKYQKALDKIAVRSKEVDQASLAMGVDPTTVVDDDPNFEAETAAFTGEKGNSVGERNRRIQEKFSKVVKAPLPTDKKDEKPAAAGDSFGWGQVIDASK